MRSVILGFLLTWVVVGPVHCADTRITLMHRIEIVSCTYAFADVGYRMFHSSNSRHWLVPAVGVLGCGGYRYMEYQDQTTRAGKKMILTKFGLDCLGMALRAPFEINFRPNKRKGLDVTIPL